MLIKLSATGDTREEYKRLVDIFRGDIVDVTATTYTVQMVGKSAKLDAFIDVIDPGLILETVRSGTVGVMRGEKCLHL